MYNLFNNWTISKFVTRKWIKLNYISSGHYSVNKKIKLKTPMLKPDLWNYSDAYIVVKWRISVTATNIAIRKNKKLTFKNNTSFKSCR